MNQLFFELIRVAIGTQETLSHPPSKGEWKQLFAMAAKQSLVGICFAAVQRLNTSNTSNTSNLSELQYLTWMGMAAKIQQRNEKVNKACDEICERVRADGFECCVLKGQSNCEYYPDNLRNLRMPGDIDLWVWKRAEDGKHRIAEVVRYAQRLNPDTHPYYHHADINKVMGVDVELHYRPSWMSAPWRDRLLQRWVMDNTPCGKKVASKKFNAVYQLVHIYRHLFFEGIGLRQLLDYYFVLKSLSQEERYAAMTTIEGLGMARFAGAVMWVIAHVFANDNDDFFLGIKSNEEEGGFLLNEIMQAGNFGQYDSRNYTTKADCAIGWGWMKLKRNMRFLSQYPEEVIFKPLFRVYHFLWRSFKLWKYE